MTVTRFGNNRYEGLTADTKPTNVAIGATYRDIQLDVDYEFNGTTWISLKGREQYSYLIYPYGTTDFRVRRGSDNAIVYTSSNGATANALGALQYCRDALGNTSPGGVIELTAGYFPVTATFTLDGNLHRHQKYHGVGTGSNYGPLSEIRATGNFPAITLNGSTASLLGVGLDSIHFSYSLNGYTNGLIRILDSVIEATFSNLSFHDSAHDDGDCFKFEILNTTATKTQYENKILNCNCRGFDNFINVNNQANNATFNSFISTLDVSNCNVWNAKRVLNVAGVSGALILDWHFHRVNFQYDATNTVAVNQGIFNYDSVVSCWQHKHSYCMIWDITSPGINYANVGTSVELTLRECNPSIRIGGSAAYLNKVHVDDYYTNASGYQGIGSIGPVGIGDGTRIGDGVLSNCSILQIPTNTVDAQSPYLIFASGATANTVTGTRRGTALFRMDNRPMLEVVCRTDVVTSNARMFIGFSTNATSGITDTPLGSADSGILIGYGSADTNYQVYHNDGLSAATKVNTGIPKAATFAKLGIICEPTGFIYLIATPAATTTTGFIVSPLVTTKVPGATTGMNALFYGVNTTITPINYHLRYAKATLRDL